MGGGPGGSAAPATASLAAAQQQKPKTVSRGWVGPAAERTQLNAPQIASDRSADGDSFRPGTYSNTRAELATSTAQGGTQQAAERPSEQRPGWEKRERGGVAGDAPVRCRR